METGHARLAFEDTDTELKIDDKTRLLIDAGVPGQSRIYDEALALIDAAREWIVLTCQFFPGGRTGQHLLKAQKRGVNVQIIYGHPRHHGNEALGHYAYNLWERTRLPNDFFKHQLPKNMQMLHAKLLATEQGAIVGSHNFATQGVRLGTAEIALLRHDVQFSQALTENILHQLSQLGMRLTRQ
jgi:phosphatidylserine/phosphatidylglycerophosphate/cardiolipin synthase-like enzyme